MAVITLTSDLGTVDYYVSVVKATILRQLENVNIVDISHNIAPFNIIHAAYVLKNAYEEFPPESIHIIGVNTETNEDNSHLAVYANGHYFIGTDNGIFSLLLDLKPDKIVEITTTRDSDNENFPLKDIFTKVACHIARGGTLEIIGTEIKEFSKEFAKLEALHDKILLEVL